MNRLAIAVVATTPDADGWGAVMLYGATRVCWFDAARLVGVAVDDRVVVADGAASLMAVAAIGKGNPTG